MIVLAMALMLPAPQPVQASAHLTGVHLDNAFRLVGSNSSGLVVSVTLDEQRSRRTSDDFALVIYDAGGRRSGTNACLAIRFLDRANSNPPWVLLDDPSGSLSRSYRALVDSHAAVVETSRRKALEAAGRYEFVFLVPTTQKQAALAYADDVVHHPADVERHLVGSFTVPQLQH